MTRASLYGIAKNLKRAAKVHEESWINAENRYSISIEDAAKGAADDADEAALINLLLKAAWNDSQDWAESVVSAVDGPA